MRVVDEQSQRSASCSALHLEPNHLKELKSVLYLGRRHEVGERAKRHRMHGEAAGRSFHVKAELLCRSGDLDSQAALPDASRARKQKARPGLSTRLQETPRALERRFTTYQRPLDHRTIVRPKAPISAEVLKPPIIARHSILNLPASITQTSSAAPKLSHGSLESPRTEEST